MPQKQLSFLLLGGGSRADSAFADDDAVRVGCCVLHEEQAAFLVIRRISHRATCSDVVR